MAQGEKRQTLRAMEDMAKTEGKSMRHEPPMFTQAENQDTHPNFINPSLYQNSFIVQIDHEGNNPTLITNSLDVDTLTEQINEFITLAMTEEASQGIITVNDTQVRFLISNKPYGKLIVFTDRSNELATLNRLLIICSLIGVLSLIILFIISLFLSKWAIDPMAKAWEKQKQFVGDASHELKTPLTVIAANADVILANPLDLVQNQSKWLGYIKTETQRMTKLVNDLLYLAKLDDDEDILYKMNFNLSESLMNICLPFESVIFEANKIFNMDITPELYYYGDEGRLKQVAVILLDNAIKHTPTGGTIDLSLVADTSKNKIQLTVKNTGPGISAEHLDKIFERFYRVDESRARETGGYGLGLAIAKSIITQHAGSINVLSSKEGPTTFCVTLPYITKR